MEIHEIRDALLWCTVINMAMLLLWSVMLTVAGDWIYRFHGKWFHMSREAFNAIHYSGILLFKIAIFLFNLVPYIALVIVG